MRQLLRQDQLAGAIQSSQRWFVGDSGALGVGWINL
jgi:hypothetical protein